MPYPNQILPTIGNKHIDCDVDDYFLIRHTEVANPAEIVDSETGFIRPRYICSPEERVDDLSSSLLGIFEHQFITLDFTHNGKGKFMFYCDPDEEVDVPIEGVDYNTNEHRNAWTIKIGLVNGIQFPYTIANEPYTATCHVVHTPMRWNFWHFSFRWHTDNLGPLDNLEPKQRQKVARRIGIASRALICNFARLMVPPHSILPEACYRKTNERKGCAGIIAGIIGVL